MRLCDECAHRATRHCDSGDSAACLKGHLYGLEQGTCPDYDNPAIDLKPPHSRRERLAQTMLDITDSILERRFLIKQGNTPQKKWADIWKKAHAQANPRKRRKPQEHRESRLQEACVKWFRLQYPRLAPLLFAVPNGGKRTCRTVLRNGAAYTFSPEAAILKREGVTAGVSDLILLKPANGYACLCVEMKTADRQSRQSEAQKAWQHAAEEVGNRYAVCRTMEEFMTTINTYLADTGEPP